MTLPRVRAKTLADAHGALGAAAALWSAPSSALRGYALREAPEHLWLAHRPGLAKRWLADPGFLSCRVLHRGRYEALETWRALGEAECVMALQEQLTEASDVQLTARQWAALGDFLRLGQHRRAAIPVLQQALDGLRTHGMGRVRLLRSLAAALWECGTTDSEIEEAVALLDEALGLVDDTPAWAEERVALLSYRATITSGTATDYGRHAYAQVLKAEMALGADTRSTRMNLAGAYHHGGESQRALALLSEVAAELDATYGDDWPVDWIVLRFNLGMVLLEMERWAEALDAFEQTHRQASAFFGEAHPRTIHIDQRIAEVLVMVEREEEATARLLTLVACCIAHHGARDEWTRLAGNGLLSLHGVESPQPLLEAPLLVALEAREQEESSLDVAVEQARCAMGEGQFFMAELWLRHGLRLAADAEDHEAVLWALEHWVPVLDELEWERDCADEAREAIASVDPEHTDIALQELLLAILNRDERFEAAVVVGQRLLGHVRLPVAHYRVADALRALGRPAEAAEHRRWCWEMECAEEGAGASDTLETAHALVGDLRAAGHAAHAIAVLEASLAAAAEATDDDDDRDAWIERLRAMSRGTDA